MRRFSPSSSAFANSTAKRMKVPSKKPPATPKVQLLTSADLGCSPTAAAVGAGRGAFWATDGVTPTTRTENESNDTINRDDAGWDMSMVAPSVFPASAPFPKFVIHLSTL